MRSREELIEVLGAPLGDLATDEALFAEAAEVRDRTVGDRVYVRGLIELSNRCRKNCFYCGIRSGNGEVERYELTDEEVLAAIEDFEDNPPGANEPGTEERIAAALEAQAEKLRALTEVLTRLSRLETGILDLHPVPGALDPMLAEAAAQFAPKAAEKGVALTVVPSGAEAVFDPKWTGEAVCNLLDNAVKYTPAGGAVTVGAAVYELFCRVRVADTGPGVPEEERSKIFRRFYRAPGAREQEGVGVGLYLAREIAQGQGGYLKVDPAEGGGAVFSVFLPRP